MGRLSPRFPVCSGTCSSTRLEIEQARLLCHRACQVIDTEGNKAARTLVALAKVAVPRAATAVIDRAIRVHGGAGVTDVTPLPAMYGWHRAMRLFDGPDEWPACAGCVAARPR